MNLEILETGATRTQTAVGKGKFQYIDFTKHSTNYTLGCNEDKTRMYIEVNNLGAVTSSSSDMVYLGTKEDLISENYSVCLPIPSSDPPRPLFISNELYVGYVGNAPRVSINIVGNVGDAKVTKRIDLTELLSTFFQGLEHYLKTIFTFSNGD